MKTAKEWMQVWRSQNWPEDPKCDYALSFEDTVRAIQDDALEAAAEAIDPERMNQEPCTNTVENCQAIIRKLKEAP